MDVVRRTRQPLDPAWSRRFVASDGGLSPRSDSGAILDVVHADRGFSVGFNRVVSARRAERKVHRPGHGRDGQRAIL